MKLKSVAFAASLAVFGTAYSAPASAGVVCIVACYNYGFFFQDGINGGYPNDDYAAFQVTTNTPATGTGTSIYSIFGFASFVPTLGISGYITGPDTTYPGSADNLIYSTAPYFDSKGISFDVSASISNTYPYSPVGDYYAFTLADPPGSYSLTNTETCISNTCNTGSLQTITGASVDPTPLPAALPLFAGGLGVMGLFGWRRRRKAQAARAAA